MEANVLLEKYKSWLRDIQKRFHDVCFNSILARVNEKEFVTKASVRMVYRFVLHLLSTGVLSSLPNCWKILPIAETSVEDFAMYPREMIQKQSKWAIANCPLWLDMFMTSKPKFPTDEEEAAFFLLKEGKIPDNSVEEVLSKLTGAKATEGAKALYAAANKEASNLGQYGRTSTRASKSAKGLMSITPMKPVRSTTKKSVAALVPEPSIPATPASTNQPVEPPQPQTSVLPSANPTVDNPPPQPKGRSRKKAPASGQEVRPGEDCESPDRAGEQLQPRVSTIHMFGQAGVKRPGAFGDSKIHVDVSSRSLKKFFKEIQKAMAGKEVTRGLIFKLMMLNQGLNKSYLVEGEQRLLGVDLIFMDWPFGQIDPDATDLDEVAQEEKLIPDVHPNFPNASLLLLPTSGSLILFVPWQEEHIAAFHYAISNFDSIVVTKRWIVHNHHPMMDKKTKQLVSI